MKNLLVLILPFLVLSTFAQQPNDDVMRRAEVMPVFQECQEERYADSPYQCSMKQLYGHFLESVVIDNPIGKKTKCSVSLVVEKDGSVSNVQIQRGPVVDIEDQNEKEQTEKILGKKLYDKVTKLNFKSPGFQDSKKVRVMLNFSVTLNY